MKIILLIIVIWLSYAVYASYNPKTFWNKATLLLTDSHTVTFVVETPTNPNIPLSQQRVLRYVITRVE